MAWRSAAGLRAVVIWLLALIVCAVSVLRATYTADLSAFLPSHPTREQAVLIDQLKEGPAARLILIGLQAQAPDAGRASVQVAPADLARLSHALAAALRQLPAQPGDKRPPFASVNNGEPVAAQADQALLMRYRYLLSQGVSPARFEVAGLREALQESLSLLGSSAGLMLQPLLTRDPTAEVLGLIESFDPGGERSTIDGVWGSADQTRAVLLAQVQADGADLDAQVRAIAAIRRQFEAVRQREGLPQVGLVLSGPPVFATESRHTIESEATRLSMIGSAIIVLLLLSIYRSPRALVLGLLPMVTGALAGITAVSWGFGTVHGITLGFGITLIGEAVDYAIYLFVQRGAASFWPTIRLGVLTSVIGFAAMLASGFPGLAQLGLFSIAGLLSAVLVTRFVLPQLIPAGFEIRPTHELEARLSSVAAFLPRLRWLVGALVLASIVVLVQHRDRLWSRELTSLSPISAADMAMDMRLRADLSAPDVRYLVVLRAASEQAALQGAEQAGQALSPLVAQGLLRGFDSPAHYLPSEVTQRRRQAALPQPEQLRARFAQAAQGLPFKLDKFEGFIEDVGQARQLPPLTRADLVGTSMMLGVDAMLMPQSGQWTALIGLRLPQGDQAAGELDLTRIRQALLAGVKGAEVHAIDLKAESEKLYSDYLGEALAQASLGGLAIVALLGAVLRSPLRLLRVVVPLASAVVIVAATLVLTGPPLTLFHLVGFLLTVAIGSNYALFFDQRARAQAQGESVLSSLLFANLTTVAGFGMLAWSQVPVLHAMGATVGPGAVLSLCLAAVLSRPAVAQQGQA